MKLQQHHSSDESYVSGGSYLSGGLDLAALENQIALRLHYLHQPNHHRYHIRLHTEQGLDFVPPAEKVP
jgi:hypothetical protein